MTNQQQTSGNELLMGDCNDPQSLFDNLHRISDGQEANGTPRTFL